MQIERSIPFDVVESFSDMCQAQFNGWCCTMRKEHDTDGEQRFPHVATYKQSDDTYMIVAIWDDHDREEVELE